MEYHRPLGAVTGRMLVYVSLLGKRPPLQYKVLFFLNLLPFSCQHCRRRSQKPYRQAKDSDISPACLPQVSSTQTPVVFSLRKRERVLELRRGARIQSHAGLFHCVFECMFSVRPKGQEKLIKGGGQGIRWGIV